MLRVLVACGEGEFADHMERALQKEYAVCLCRDGLDMLNCIRSFDPDVVVVDARLPGADIFAVLRGVRNTFRNVALIVISSLLDQKTVNQFASLAVNQLVAKPCTVSAVVAHIERIGNSIRNVDNFDHRREVNSILLDLNFRLGTKPYHTVLESVLTYYALDNRAQMKDVYYHVARYCGGTAQQQEKSLRDGIKAATKRGDMRLWQLYFPPGTDGKWVCPTNEEFLARIAGCLKEGGREKMPYEE